MSLFSYLFPSKPEIKSSEWTQAQREALVDLLYVAIYVDNHLSVLEETKLEEELKRVDWDGPQSSTLFINDAIKRARDARNDEAYKKSYLAEISNQLGGRKLLALEALDRVISSDGTDPRESAFLKEVRAIFNS